MMLPFMVNEAKRRKFPQPQYAFPVWL